MTRTSGRIPSTYCRYRTLLTASSLEMIRIASGGSDCSIAAP